MNLFEETKYLLTKYKINPDTDRGQNFLISEKSLDAIVKAGDLSADDMVMEVGSGLGTMTVKVAAQAGRVISFESDRRLKELLEKLRQTNTNLEIFFDDFLKVDFEYIKQHLALQTDGAYKVVANIPYYITGKLIEHILSFPLLPSLMILLVQKEVGEKIVAKPGDYSKQSLGVQFYGRPSLVGKIAADNFWPKPAVESVILKIEDIHHWNYSEDEQTVWRLIRMGFSSKRKKLINNLAAGLQWDKKVVADCLQQVNIDPNLRAQDVTLEQWLIMTASTEKRKNERTESRPSVL